MRLKKDLKNLKICYLMIFPSIMQKINDFSVRKTEQKRKKKNLRLFFLETVLREVFKCPFKIFLHLICRKSKT